MEISKDKKIYFSSDNHLGSPSTEESQEREKIFVSWLIFNLRFLIVILVNSSICSVLINFKISSIYNSQCPTESIYRRI